MATLGGQPPRRNVGEWIRDMWRTATGWRSPEDIRKVGRAATWSDLAEDEQRILEDAGYDRKKRRE